MAIGFDEARNDLARLIKRVNTDRVEIEIMSDHGSAVLMSKSNFDSLMETAYLLGSPENAQRLMRAVESTRNERLRSRRD